ncbi:extracellular solute-binding protein [Streptomyces sp. NPDC001876]|uniref:extracellular solute-binding protein n=1 Tax=Streptomyces sp. NPDC001876 TaxID=3154402 RepID=UPI00332DC78B
MKRRTLLAGALATTAAGATAVTGCSSGSGKNSNEIEVLYRVEPTWPHLEKSLKGARTEYEAAHPDVKIKLTAVQGSNEDYYTKLALLNRSADSAPDVYLHDTFQVNADVAAGKLAPLDDFLAKWPDWQEQFPESVQKAAQGLDGKTYGVPISTDTRGLWYHKDVLRSAGLPVPWTPKTWDDVLEAARAVKRKVRGVTPFSMYSTKILGEAATMQGFEMLLYGTPGGTLFDNEKWVTSGKGITDSLKFVDTVYREDLGPKKADALNAKLGDKVLLEWFPKGKLGIALDGAWASSAWTPTSPTPWADWTEKMGWTPMPTQNGEAPGAVSMSGGWVMAVSSYSKRKQDGFDFITFAMNKKHAMEYSMGTGDLAVRKDVSADPKYIAGNPAVEFWTGLAKVSHYRPAYEAYPKVSTQIQEAMEAVTLGSKSPEEAAEQYAEGVERAVGADNVVGKAS